jgi:hypothetical protein
VQQNPIFQAMVTLFGLLSVAAMLLTTYFGTDRDDQNVNKACTSQVVITLSYNSFHMTFVPGAGLLSVGIYICVYFAYKRAVVNHRSAGADSNAITNQQRRLTVTLGIITVSTLFLFDIPMSIFAVSALMNVIPPQVVILGIFMRFSIITNVAIYLYRQKEMRAKMWALICCKNLKMTATVSSVM